MFGGEAFPHLVLIVFPDQGAHWPRLFPEDCNGTRQSPIDIKDPQCDKALNNSIELINYDEAGCDNFTLKNNGHSVVLSGGSTGAHVNLGGRLGAFKFLQLHFHWGKNDSVGSEHTLMGKPTAAEVSTDVCCVEVHAKWEKAVAVELCLVFWLLLLVVEIFKRVRMFVLTYASLWLQTLKFN